MPNETKSLKSALIQVCFLLLLSACSSAPIGPSGTPSMLDPYGPNASNILYLWWLMFALGAFVFTLVVLLLAAALLRQRRANLETEPELENDKGNRWIIWGGIVLPIWILAIVLWYSIQVLSAVSQRLDENALEVQVIGRRWWWEIHYRDEGITTANELHIPVNTPVQIRLESGDVIHSFWVPQLHGKMDLVPTRVNYLTIQADEIGIYQGRCAEYCGLQHAHMGFAVIADSEEDFNAWISNQQQEAVTPEDELSLRGQEVFLEVGCTYCHTIRGLDDSMIDASHVDIGPDLTHLQSRTMLAAASISNNRGNLAGWISDPQHIKPGVLMPTIRLSSEDLQALIAYLEMLIIWFGQFNLVYMINSLSCKWGWLSFEMLELSGKNVVQALITLFAAVLMILTMRLPWREWRAYQQQLDAGLQATEQSRRSFSAFLALSLNSLLLLFILASFFTILALDPCW